MRNRILYAGTTVVMLLTMGCASGGDRAGVKTLALGDAAPDFALPGNVPWVSSFEGEKNVLLAFYPKAFTPGCTKQMCGYRDTFAEFESLETEVIAVSNDNQEKAGEFKQKHGLPFLVVGDPDHAIIDAYGVPLMNMVGMELAKRSVVLIDKKGKVRHIDWEYAIGNDRQALIDAIAAIQ